MSAKENQRIALTKRLLQEGLLTLLKNQPIDKVSVTELCRISGINRSTFYNHYISPQDVLSDLESNVSKDLMAITARHKPNLSSLACIEEICTYLKNHKNVTTILITFNADTDLVEVFRKIEQHFASSQVPRPAPGDPETRHLASSFICTGFYYMIREWLIRDIQKTPREIAELALYFITNAAKYEEVMK